MDNLQLHETPLASWHALVTEASSHAGVHLIEELESYLVFLLMRYTTHSEVLSSTVADDYFKSCLVPAQARTQSLRDMGDKCLLFSGFFPGCAEKRRVRLSYFVHMGQLAYDELACHHAKQQRQLFVRLCEQFVSLMDVLHVARDMHQHDSPLSPLQAFELWQDTKSGYAERALGELSQQGVLFHHQIVDEH